MDRKIDCFCCFKETLDPDRNKRERKNLIISSFCCIRPLSCTKHFSNTKIATEAGVVFVLHWRRLFIRQETKINAISRAANKFGEKKKKLKNFVFINFRESVNIELNFREFGQNSRNSRKFLLAKVSAPKVHYITTSLFSDFIR